MAAPTTPFAASGGGVWTAQGDEIIPEVFQTTAAGPVLVETGSLPMAYGAFRSAMGSNGFDIHVAGGDDREVFGGSIWSDGFTVTGGGSDGVLTLSTQVHGSISGLGEMGYALFVSSKPYDFDALIAATTANNAAKQGFWALTLPDSVRVLFTGAASGCSGVGNWSRDCGHVPYENYQGPLNVTLTADVPVTAGQTLYVLSAFAGGVGHTGGSQSFLNSADFGITAPVGMTLQSVSGAVYAAAVPEPSTWLLFAVGLGVAFVGRGLRRRSSRLA